MMGHGSTRWIVALLICTLLAALLYWQFVRERAMRACEESGGAWHGPTSTCRPLRPGTILRRSLERAYYQNRSAR